MIKKKLVKDNLKIIEKEIQMLIYFLSILKSGVSPYGMHVKLNKSTWRRNKLYGKVGKMSKSILKLKGHGRLFWRPCHAWLLPCWTAMY
jgi:hypothetical protein